MTINANHAISNGESPEPSHGGSMPSVLDRRFPPIAELTVASVALMLSGGVYLASHLPTLPPLAPAIGLLASGGALTVVAMVLLSRLRPFAWGTFFLVARWAFVSYLVIAGILGFIFIFDHTRGSTLTVLILTLVVFAIDVPMIIAFTVARYDDTTSTATAVTV
jgi:hypothetical protein